MSTEPTKRVVILVCAINQLDSIRVSSANDLGTLALSCVSEHNHFLA